MEEVKNLKELFLKLNGTPNEVTKLLSLKYRNGNSVIHKIKSNDRVKVKAHNILDNTTTILEIQGLIQSHGWTYTISLIEESDSMEDFIWNLPSMDAGKMAVASEIAVQQLEKLTTKGTGKCPGCKLEGHLIFAAPKQMASGDEAVTTDVKCLNCGKAWKKR
jgi:DNA-directed RNA polymerase subunit M/transcription elongation factor TFIIS